MFSKLSFIVASVLATLAVTQVVPRSLQCCNSVGSSNSTAVAAVARLVGLNITGLDVPIGLSCSPITVSGNLCAGSTVTCNAPKAEWGGLIALNCTHGTS
ncbi:Hydrophobin 2 [Mycena venus]|uniref:Hydrophobin n=1 Tax=Mycena venus TaxID=2733690 RepID=A0A8H7CYD3_9AGAR|nr:Hydrophobin 2 [Mycena venus]